MIESGILDASQTDEYEMICAAISLENEDMELLIAEKEAVLAAIDGYKEDIGSSYDKVVELIKELTNG